MTSEDIKHQLIIIIEPKQDLEWLAEVAWSRKCNVGCSGGGSGGGSSGMIWRLGYKEAILLHNWQP